ncbi:MAG: DUF2723 domain-containing protein [Myxococcales bacterium]|jgi:hypothetical protein
MVRLPPAAVALAALVPSCCYLLTASAYGYWLDAGEFVAAAVDLGIAHPPGHPLHALLGKLATLVPLGPLAARVAALSALTAGAASAFLCVAIARTLHAGGDLPRRLAVPISLGATWLVAGSHALWLQAVRPEVYALQAALSALVLERTVAFGTGRAATRAPLTAALALGLALTNHHFLALLLVPALLPMAASLLRPVARRRLLTATGAGLLGLSVYVYLPLRAAAHPTPNLGAPTTLERIYWVVSAQVFRKSMDGDAPSPWSQRLVDVLLALGESVHLGVIFALGGLYLLARRPEGRTLAWIWGSTLVVTVLARAQLGFVAGNPDALGYLAPALMAVAALAASLVGRLASALTAPRAAPVATLLAIASLVVGLAQFPRNAAASSLSRFTQTDTFAQALGGDAPPRSVLLLHSPGSVFQLWWRRVAQGERPDVVGVPVPFLHYPGMTDALTRRAPELSPLLDRGEEGALAADPLRRLALRRPVLIEPDVRVPPRLYPLLLPEGNFLRVAPGASAAQRVRAAVAHRRLVDRLYRRLGDGAREAATRERLLWSHYCQALYFMGTGQRAAAARSIERALAIEPRAVPLPTMREAVRRAGGEPMDVAPFMSAIEQPSPSHQTPTGPAQRGAAPSE